MILILHSHSRTTPASEDAWPDDLKQREHNAHPTAQRGARAGAILSMKRWIFLIVVSVLNTPPFMTGSVLGQCETGALVVEVEFAGTDFGAHLDADGDVAAVSDLRTFAPDRIHMFRRNGIEWHLEDWIDPPVAVTGPMAVAGDIVAIPATAWNDGLLIYRDRNGAWLHEETLVPAGQDLHGWGVCFP
jgi:hypothetical protein